MPILKSFLILLILFTTQGSRAATPAEIQKWIADLKTGDNQAKAAAVHHLRQNLDDAGPAVPTLMELITPGSNLYRQTDGETITHAQSIVLKIARLDPQFVRLVLKIARYTDSTPSNDPLPTSNEEEAYRILTARQFLTDNTELFRGQLVHMLDNADSDIALSALLALKSSRSVHADDYLGHVLLIGKRLDHKNYGNWQQFSYFVASLAKGRASNNQLAELLYAHLDYLKQHGTGNLSDEAVLPFADHLYFLEYALERLAPRNPRTVEAFRTIASLLDPQAGQATALKAEALLRWQQKQTSAAPDTKSFLDKLILNFKRLHYRKDILAPADHIFNQLKELNYRARPGAIDLALEKAEKEGSKVLVKNIRDALCRLWDESDEAGRAYLLSWDSCERNLREMDKIP